MTERSENERKERAEQAKDFLNKTMVECFSAAEYVLERAKINNSPAELTRVAVALFNARLQK